MNRSEPDLLIIDRVMVEERFRGHGLGLLAVRTAIECFGEGCGLVGIYPFPLQFARGVEARDQAEENALRDATAKVAAHWERLGFKRFGKNGVRVLSPAHVQPPLQRVLKGIRAFRGNRFFARARRG